MGFQTGRSLDAFMRQGCGLIRGCVIAVTAIFCGCSTPKPPAYTRFPQTLISPSTVSNPPSAAAPLAATPVVPVAAPPTVLPASLPPPAKPVAASPTNAPAKATTATLNDNEPWTPILDWCRSKSLPLPEIQAGSRTVKIGGITHFLGFEPAEQGGAVCIHPLDRIKTFEPLLLPPTWPHPKTVVLDPGHGGTQVGTRSLTGNRFEKEFTLDWAQRLKPLLEARGWTVALTRTNDVDLSLNERVHITDTLQAGLFISLHFNSSFPNTQAHGLETYCVTPCGLASTTTRFYPDDTTANYMNNEHDAANLILARRIHRHLLMTTGAADRGIRRARFMDVLRKQSRPAVLIEGGFLSNPEESKSINTPAYRQRLAEAVARALE